MKRAYEEAMDHVRVTPQMRARILEAVRKEAWSGEHARASAGQPTSMRWGVLAACVALLVGGALTIPRLMLTSGQNAFSGGGTPTLESVSRSTDESEESFPAVAAQSVEEAAAPGDNAGDSARAGGVEANGETGNGDAAPLPSQLRGALPAELEGVAGEEGTATDTDAGYGAGSVAPADVVGSPMAAGEGSLEQEGISFPSAEALSEYLGFPMADVPGLSFAPEETGYHGWPGLGQISYLGEGVNVVYRKSLEPEEGMYEEETSRNVDGVLVRLQGAGERFHLALWEQDGAYCSAWTSMPQTEDSLADLVAGIMRS